MTRIVSKLGPGFGDRDWALRAARQDASYLISPSARRRALAILVNDEDPEANAARVILNDGGAQMGQTPAGGGQYRSASMDAWRAAADVLGVFDDEGQL